MQPWWAVRWGDIAPQTPYKDQQMPDINSLPGALPQMATDNQTHSPHQAPHSLAAAAALNAHEERRSSNPSTRRRSSVRINLNLMDPDLPMPSEVQMSPTLHSHRPSWPASPSHQRAPSLGEMHQELENEQEAQVVCAIPLQHTHAPNP